MAVSAVGSVPAKADEETARMLFERLQAPSAFGSRLSDSELAQFIEIRRQQLDFNARVPRAHSVGIINGLVRPEILRAVTGFNSGIEWDFNPILNRDRLNGGRQVSIGQVPDPSGQGSILMGVARCTAVNTEKVLRIPFAVSARVDSFSATQIDEQATPERMRTVRARGAAFYKLQVPADSSPGRWASELQGSGKEQCYLRSGELLDNVALGVPSEVLVKHCEKLGIGFLLLPWSRRDPAFLEGQTGQYMEPEGLGLRYRGDGLKGGRLHSIDAYISFHAEAFAGQAKIV